MEENIKHLNELLSLYFTNKNVVFSFTDSESFPLSFKIESTEGVGIFSIVKGDYLEGSLSFSDIENSFRFYHSCRDDIIETWNLKKSPKLPAIPQRRYRINLWHGVLRKVTIITHKKAEYYELYYAYSPETKLYSIKGLVGVNQPDENKHFKIVFRMIAGLEDFHGTINDKISKKIVLRLKHSFISTFIVNSIISKNRSIEPEIVKIILKLKPGIYKQDNFDQETIDAIKHKTTSWFSQYHKIRLNSSL